MDNQTASNNHANMARLRKMLKAKDVEIGELKEEIKEIKKPRAKKKDSKKSE